jgi:hypothetical protein
MSGGQPELVRDTAELMTPGVHSVAIMANDTRSTRRIPLSTCSGSPGNELPVPYLLDETQAVARAYGAVCTPDFFGFNARLELQYRGRLDDSGRQPGAGNAAREFLAMQEVAETGRGPERQVPPLAVRSRRGAPPDSIPGRRQSDRLAVQPVLCSRIRYFRRR